MDLEDYEDFIDHAKINHTDREKQLKEQLRLDHLNPEEKEEIQKIILKYNKLFYLPGDQLGTCTDQPHKIRVTDRNNPLYIRQYRVPFAQRETITKEVKKLLDNEIIQPSNSPWNFPLLLVKKKQDASKEQKYCVVIDYRMLNRRTIPDTYPLPNICDILDRLGRAVYWTTIDLKSGFYQLGLDPEDRELTAFSTPEGKYEFKRLPMGLINSPAGFMRTMNNILSGLTDLLCFVYLDDIVVWGINLQDHNHNLDVVFKRLSDNGVKLEPDKCEFLKREIQYLGHIISQKGVQPDKNKTEKIKTYPTPTNIKEIQQFLGLVGYYRKFIKGFANIARPLSELTMKDKPFTWTDRQQEAFKTLREALTEQPILQFPDFSKPFSITCDASGIALGAILNQEKDGEQLPVHYISRTLNKAETRYSTIERELLACVYATKMFRPYIFGTAFKIYTDHLPLTYLKNTSDLGTRLTKLRTKLFEYNCEILYVKGKDNVVADSLSRIPQIYSIQTIDEEENAEDISEQQKIEILKEVHDSKIGGHRGINATIEAAREITTWPNMKDFITDYIKKCEKCQYNKSNFIPKMIMKITDTPMKPLEKICLDLCGPFEISETGNKYLLTIQCLFSKFTTAIGIPNGESETIAKNLLHHFIFKFGIPDVILTDMGQNFCSTIIKNLCKLLGIKKINTSPYRPSSNGSLEKFHHTMKTAIRHYINPKQTNWDEIAQISCFVYNIIKNSTTGYKPVMLMNGRNVELPSSLKNPNKAFYSYDDYLTTLKQNISIIFQNAHENILKTKEQTKMECVKNRTLKQFNVGDKILKKAFNIRQGRSKKLSQQWLGPYEVTQKIGDHTIKIKKGRTTEVAHIDNVKHFIS